MGGAAKDAKDFVGGGLGSTLGNIAYAMGLTEHADGGVVTRPTPALVGEAGPEVIIPVTRPGRAMELMGKAAEMMGLGGGGGGGAGAPMTVTFSPNITIHAKGEEAASIADQVERALGRSLDDLEQRLQELEYKRRRVALM